MTIEDAAAEIVQAALEDTTRRQREASDPEASAWVSANAGTGKTHVLTSRTLRLLLAGTEPQRILCLTYTKAAAAEMSKRVFKRLAAWVTESDPVLDNELAGLLGRLPSADERFTARTLFTRAIETPGGLKVQTIHAFCERLLQRFPMEAGVAPGFSTLDDDLGRTLRREAIDRTITEALADSGSPLGRALATAVAYAAEERFEDVLSMAIADRRWLGGGEDTHQAAGSQGSASAAREATLRAMLGVRPKIALADIEAEMSTLLSEAQLSQAAVVLGEGSKTDVKNAGFYALAKQASAGKQRIKWLKAALLTQKDEARAQIVTKTIREREPALCDVLTNARDRLAELVREELALKCVEATLALATMATSVLQHYRAAKERMAALDFDDLIEQAVRLLATNQSDATDWVLYKLDGGIDHILVDESQDTSPEQWSIVEALAQEFFSGEGAQEKQRTLFAVGDEKQSIYSFQGAAPDMFAKMGASFSSLAAGAGQKLKEVPLDLSFRTVAPVLQSVDRVFANASRTPGVAGTGGWIPHAVKRLGDAGLVEIWPLEEPEAPSETDAFEPLAEHPAATPVERLAARIADTIAGWLKNEEPLPSRGRPVRPGDVLILCRKRKPFAAPMVAALKARGIAVAGADRINLTQQTAVQDLMALGDFVALPEDDLTLAAVLKSPLIGLDEEALFDLAHLRKGSLWKSLIDKRELDSRYREAAARLVDLRQRADFLPPFEFYAKALDEDGLRKRLLERLGHEAADPIDEFLNLAIAYDDRQAPSLTGFLSWLREADREIKRDMEQGANEVRVMTVHASKGLEAPIVFLPDTCTTTGAGGAKDPLVRLQMSIDPGQNEPPRVWGLKASSRITAIKDAREHKNRKEQEELNRLLYVAMTRAEDRLYVCGFKGRNKLPMDCWYNIIRDGLEETMDVVTAPDGSELLRCENPQRVVPAKERDQGPGAVSPLPLPQWALTKAPRVPHVAAPLAPSQIVPYEADIEGEPVPGPALPKRTGVPEEPSAPEPLAASADPDRFLRGTLTHALFEHLPGIAPEKRREAAQTFLSWRGQALTARIRQRIVDEAMGVLEHPDFAPLFGPRSRAEVSVAAELARPDGGMPALRLSGSIDRLAEVDGRILIVDYKTNRDVPAGESDVAEAYAIQLAAYRLALNTIYPDRQVRAALLWTRVPRLLEVPADRLDLAEALLWKVSAASP